MTESKLEFPCAEDSPQRIDKFLVGCMPDLSRSRLQGLIKDGFVTVNEKVVDKVSQMVAAGDVVEIRIPPNEPSDLVAENIPLAVIYEDEQLMVINKPAGMVVHPSRACHRHAGACRPGACPGDGRHRRRTAPGGGPPPG